MKCVCMKNECLDIAPILNPGTRQRANGVHGDRNRGVDETQKERLIPRPSEQKTMLYSPGRSSGCYRLHPWC